MFVFLIKPINLQKSAAGHIGKHCPPKKSEKIYIDWIWWIFQGLPFHHAVSLI